MSTTPRLILFDIDGTLYHGDGSGRAAFADTARAIVGDSFVDHPIDFAGRLDTWIYAELMRLNKIEVTHELTTRFMDLSPGFLKTRIESGEYNIRPCAGALELVEQLRSIQTHEHDLTLGLLTGNWPRNGRVKIASVGFNPEHFIINAWGHDGPTRNDLPPVAHARYHEHHRGTRKIQFNDIVIIGDTLHDVNCALVNGCRSLAVATGWCSAEELARARPDHVVEDLTQIDEIVDWILTSPEAAPGTRTTPNSPSRETS
jgi:phosphoglycolate phosphatase-like HAD superfamily hydrolase